MAAVGVAAWLAVGVAQQSTPASSAPSQTTFRAGVDVVTLDVSVFDSRRRPVKGLAAATANAIANANASTSRREKDTTATANAAAMMIRTLGSRPDTSPSRL